VACRREIVIRAGADIRVFLSAACSLAPVVVLKKLVFVRARLHLRALEFRELPEIESCGRHQELPSDLPKTAQFGLTHSDRVIQPNAFSISGRFLWQFGTHGRHLAASTWQADHVVAIVVRNCDKAIFNHV